MSKENINVTPEAIEEAYKVLGITLSKSENPSLEKSEDNSEDNEDPEEEDSLEDKKEDKKEKKKKPFPKMEKSEDSAVLGAIEKLSKGFDEKFNAIATINKGLTDALNETREELEKAQEQIEELSKAPMGRKSITTQGFLEKAFQENETNGKKMLSISQHKSALQKMLIEKAGFDGDVLEKSNVNEFWANEMQYFEATNSLHPKAIEKLYNEDNIQLVK